MSKIKVILRGSHGGELDCRVVEPEDGVDPFEDGSVTEAVQDIALNCTFSVGDTITFEEVLG
jgi:hypothetical protein